MWTVSQSTIGQLPLEICLEAPILPDYANSLAVWLLEVMFEWVWNCFYFLRSANSSDKGEIPRGNKNTLEEMDGGKKDTANYSTLEGLKFCFP